MKHYEFDIDKTWLAIFQYVEYDKLTSECKRAVDDAFELICSSLDRRTFSSTNGKCQVLKTHEINTEDLIDNYGNWLIDNNLGLIFSDRYGAHSNLQLGLLMLYLVKDRGLGVNQIRTIKSMVRSEVLVDLYTGLHLGIYCSGANESRDLIAGKDYPFRLKRQMVLRDNINCNKAIYEKIDAIRDLNRYIAMC